MIPTQLNEYREKHFVEYKKRIKEQEEKVLAEENEKARYQKVVEDLISKIADFNDAISNTHILSLIVEKLSIVLECIRSTLDEENKNQVCEDIRDIVMQLFQSVNNTNAKIDFNNQREVEKAKDIRIVMQDILFACGIIDTNNESSLDVQYDMDCSKDEELARQLSMMNMAIDRVPPVRRRRRTTNHRHGVRGAHTAHTAQ